MAVLPVGPGQGITFKRTDIECGNNLIPAQQKFVSDTFLCTTIQNEDGISVSTIEHLMAALVGCGIHNALIEIEGPEVPIMDGSSVEFVTKILEVGTVELGVPAKVIKILKPVVAEIENARAILEPCEGFEISFQISFPEPVGQQKRNVVLSNGNIVRHLVDCRTFCAYEDVEKILDMNRGLGGNEENVLIYSVDMLKYLSKLRYKDECVRHKILDAIGDMALSGSPILGRFIGIRSGHAVTNALLRKLFKSPDSYEMMLADEYIASVLPGVGAKLSDIPAVH